MFFAYEAQYCTCFVANNLMSNSIFTVVIPEALSLGWD
jgi:hypothetical protein